MNCRSCGLINPPFERTCGHCRRGLRGEDEAEERRREWDALSPALRTEQERHYAGLRARFDDHLLWLRRHRLVHAILGGGFVSLGMNAPAAFPSWSLVPIDFAIGAAAGLLLNRAGGGAYRGLALFCTAGVLSVVALLQAVDREIFWMGGWMFSTFGLGFVGAVGYYLGLKLDIDHVERQFL